VHPDATLGRHTTHELIRLPGGAVRKRYRSWARGEPGREWTALTLLAEQAPDLAPAPRRDRLDEVPPSIEMSALPGRPLAGPLNDAQADALAESLARLWGTVPAPRLRAAYGSATNCASFCRQVRGLSVPHGETADPVGDRALARAACDAGRSWLSGFVPEPEEPDRLVLGQGDANLANFLWDGARVRIVDFEDSGPSDRPFELALVVEHRSMWHDGGVDGDGFVDRFELSARERGRLLELRRLAALYWLLRPGRAGEARRVDGAFVDERQAERLLALLG
jgi:Ser/Thr protein kinase RdoA (MazF antagonist)